MKPLTSKYPGVYALFNLDNGKVYVGSADKSLRKRTNAHITELLRGKHANIHLQRAFNLDGRGAFHFIELEQCASSECIEREQWWMNELEAFGPEGYNICPTAGNRKGTKHSEETKEKLRKATTGRTVLPEWCDAISEGLKGVPKTEEHKQATKDTHWSKGDNAEEISQRIAARLSVVNKGKRQSQETKDKLSKALKGRPKATFSSRGERNGSAKMTKDDLRDVLNWLFDGVPHKEIAERKGVSKSTIDKISRGVEWIETITELLEEMKPCQT